MSWKMARFYFSVAVVSLLVVMLLSGRAAAVLVIASDDASQSAYNDGWQIGDNGGTGFAAWSTINNQAGSGSGGGFLANSNGESHINTSGKAFGVFGHHGGVGQAIRSFSNPISVGHTFSLKMDNGLINDSGNSQGGGTVGFGLRNSSGNNLFEFFFVGGQSEYKVNGSGGSVGTGVSFTNEGLELAFTLTGTNSFSFVIHKLIDNAGVNTTITGNLMSPSGGQAISQLRLFNANAGEPNENNAFYNSFSVTAIPEASAVGFFSVAIIVTTATTSLCRRRSARRAS